jgi:hypothetical protein
MSNLLKKTFENILVKAPVACMMIVNDDSRVINKREASLTDDDRVIIYDRHMFIVQAPGVDLTKLLTYSFCKLDLFIAI